MFNIKTSDKVRPGYMFCIKEVALGNSHCTLTREPSSAAPDCSGHPGESMPGDRGGAVGPRQMVVIRLDQSSALSGISGLLGKPAGSRVVQAVKASGGAGDICLPLKQPGTGPQHPKPSSLLPAARPPSLSLVLHSFSRWTEKLRSMVRVVRAESWVPRDTDAPEAQGPCSNPTSSREPHQTLGNPRNANTCRTSLHSNPTSTAFQRVALDKLLNLSEPHYFFPESVAASESC